MYREEGGECKNACSLMLFLRMQHFYECTPLYGIYWNELQDYATFQTMPSLEYDTVLASLHENTRQGTTPDKVRTKVHRTMPYED